VILSARTGRSASNSLRSSVRQTAPAASRGIVTGREQMLEAAQPEPLLQDLKRR
jgi:hypothetical protein